MLTPWGVSERDIDLIKETIGNIAYPGTIDCLEWGSGGSTIVFPQYLKKRWQRFRWQAIEHDPVWRQRVADEAMSLQLFEVGVLLVRCDGDPHLAPMDDYVSYPFRLGRRFRFVFVDGRKRRRCLITASKLLDVGGVVVLHDAEREYYHSAFDHFTRHERIGDKLWRGWVDA